MTKEVPVLKVVARKKKECRNVTTVLVKVAAVKHPMPQHIVLRITFKDGTEKIAKAYFSSMYKDYAFYFLYAADAKEVAPRVNQIQAAKAYEEERRRRNEPR
jgi:desulfoferrodoxin (superoxide reductase-like protein)